jgi:hypothetical protein
MVFGYTELSMCLSWYDPNVRCWNPFNAPSDPRYNFATPVIAFYVGIIVTISGAVMLVGGDIAKLHRKNKAE